MTDEEKAAVEETVARAKTLLFDKNGKRRPYNYYVTVYALQTLLRPATIEEAFNPKPGHLLFDWGEKTYVYDGGLAEAFMADAPTSTFCDQVLRTAAAAMLEATGEIGNPRLRSFACACLTGGATPISKTKRGRSSKDTWGRDTVIVGVLFPRSSSGSMLHGTRQAETRMGRLNRLARLSRKRWLKSGTT